jgi:hypothetical protein
MHKAIAGKGWIDVIERSDNGRIFASAGREAQGIVWIGKARRSAR